MSIKAEQYDMVKIERIGAHLVLKVKYPSCTKCEFDGVKVMVFLDVDEMQAMRWRRIDPHFRKPRENAQAAPSQDARFPNTDSGWTDAVTYTRRKTNVIAPR